MLAVLFISYILFIDDSIRLIYPGFNVYLLYPIFIVSLIKKKFSIFFSDKLIIFSFLYFSFVFLYYIAFSKKLYHRDITDVILIFILNNIYLFLIVRFSNLRIECLKKYIFYFYILFLLLSLLFFYEYVNKASRLSLLIDREYLLSAHDFSYMALFGLCMSFIYIKSNLKMLLLIPAFAVYSLGSSLGAVIAFIIFIIVFYHKNITKFSSFLFLVFIISMIYFHEYLYSINRLLNYDFINSTRYLIITNAFQNIDLFTFLFGFTLESNDFKANFHNGFLDILFISGVFNLIIYILMVFLILRMYRCLILQNQSYIAILPFFIFGIVYHMFSGVIYNSPLLICFFALTLNFYRYEKNKLLSHSV